MLNEMVLSEYWSDLSGDALFDTQGGVNWAVVIGGIACVAIGGLAIGTVALVGGVIGGPVGAAAAAKACFGVVAKPCLLAGGTAICVGMMV